jgi:PAS domain S-box-containing protein
VVIHANSAAGRLLGVGLETLLGEKMGDLLLQEGAGERQRTLLQRLLSGEEGLQSEGGAPSLSADYSVRCSDGRTVPVHLSGALLSRSSAVSTEVEGAVLVLHDLRERLRDEQQQQYIAFQSGIAEMSASILHHIGNTLVGIGGRVGGIGQRVQDMNRLREILNELGSSADVSEEAMREAMKVSAKALHNLSGEEGIAGDLQHIEESIRRIDRTISVHRSASRSDLSSSCFPLAGLVEDALFLLREPMQAAEIRVVTELNRELNQQVEMPRNPAIQMVLNLLQNSMDAILRRQAKAEAEWQGEIRVSIQAAPEWKVMLSIEDNGCGIEEEQRQHLFTPGYSTKPGGSGKNYFIKNRNKRQDTGSNPKSLCCNLLLTAGETLPAQSMIEVGIFMFVT